MSESVLYGGTSSARVRIHHLQQAKERGEKWAMLTAYDTYSAAIFEEAGIDVSAVTYQGSQPWPFPRSLMLGFRAVAPDAQATPDGREILDLRWFTREQLRAVARDGTVVLPGPISISHALIVSWLGEPLPTPPGRS